MSDNFPFPAALKAYGLAEWLAVAALLLLGGLLMLYVAWCVPTSGLRDAARLNGGCPPVCRQVVMQSLKCCLPCLRAAFG